MKKVKNLLLLAAFPAAFVLLTSELMYSSGSPGGKSGSPGDGGQNCTQCHSGTAITQEFWISNPILFLNGYEPGVEYDIIVYGVHQGVSKFGFEATAENATGEKIGTFAPGLLGTTKLTNNNTAVTHNLAGSVPQTDSSILWLFKWTAPPELAGDITFYTAVNAANGDGATSGDQIYLSTMTVEPSGNVGLRNMPENRGFSVFPNPSTGILHVQMQPHTANRKLTVIALNGEIILSVDAQSQDMKLDLTGLPKGIYLVRTDNHVERIVLY